MIFVDYDQKDCFDYHVLDVVLLDPDFVYDFDNLGLEPQKFLL